MSILDKIKVNTHYTRSINLERDIESIDIVNAYVPTSRAIRTIERVASTFHTGLAPRAWSLVGPYGSGKSSFSVFLSHLLGDQSLSSNKAAIKKLNGVDRSLGGKFSKQTKGSQGYLKILVTGSPEPMSSRILSAAHEAAESYWLQSSHRKPKIVSKLLESSANSDITPSEILKLFRELQLKLEITGCKGVLLVVDELGKFLEYEARHYGANDIYLLQSLAELACSGSEVNIYLFVLLHQSFEQYAKGLGESLKNEWSKVQGRFEEVPFLESSEQVLRVVSAAFEHSLRPAEKKELGELYRKKVEVLFEQEALPSALGKEDAISLFESCYPLHPLTAILLPMLCQKVAQNERTLFSYLGSHEEFGLQYMLGELSDLSEFVMPHHIYDYFIANQSAVISDQITNRRWAEVVTAVDRLGDSSTDHLKMLKTIGLLNIVGGKGGFKASKAILETCAENKSAFSRVSKALREKSVVTYRKYNGEFRVWQGSDFDLDEAFDEELNNLGNFSLAEQLNVEAELQPIVARRYTIENGTLRYFLPVFVDAQSYSKLPENSGASRIIFYLASGQDDESAFRQKVAGYYSELDLVVLCLNGIQLREAVSETIILKRVQSSSQELNTDPIAKREFDDRLSAAIRAQSRLLKSLIDYPHESEWWHAGDKVTVDSKRSLQQQLSNVLSKAYNQAPIVHNELINKDKLSSQAAAARNKLLLHMYHAEEKLDLGIEKFPPEKPIYRSVLRETAIHAQGADEKWSFVKPKGIRANRSNIKPVWAKIDEFLASTEERPKSFADLNNELQAAPYGVKAGLLPILYIASYVVNQHELAIYENRIYQPHLTEEMVDRFVKRPDEFTIQRFRIEGVKAAIFKEYGKVIKTKKDDVEPTLLDLAKPLVAFMKGLPEYTQKTRKGLSSEAQRVRTAFNLSKSPESLLFELLPEALGYTSDSDDFDGFADSLKNVISELKLAHEGLINRQVRLLANAANIGSEDADELSTLRSSMFGRFKGLENYTVDLQGMRAFILRVTKKEGSDREWLENILMFLGTKPSSKWTDSEVDQAEYKLAHLGKSLIDLQKLQIHEHDINAKDDSDYDFYLIKSLKKGHAFREEVVAVDKERSTIVAETKASMVKALDGLTDRELRLAALAELVDEFLEVEKVVVSDEGLTIVSKEAENG